MYLEGRNGFFKLWYFLRTYILTLKRFDLILQGSLLIVILLESNVYLLLKRDQNEGLNPAFIQDWVLIATGGTEFIFGAILAWIGRGKRQFCLSGWLAVTAATSLLVLAFPFAQSNPVNVELCAGETISSNLVIVDDNYVARTIYLIITALLCSLTKISLWAHGLTYLDDHEPHNGPYFYGILISIRLSLGLSGSSWLRASSLTDDWWKAHLSLSMLTLMFAVLFPLFPKKMSQWQDETILVDTDFLPSLKRVICNKTVALQTVALACLSTAVFGFTYYEEAYVQARFHIEAIRQEDPRTSRLVSDIFRPLVVIFFVMIFRVRFSDRRADGVKANTASRVGGIVAGFVCVFIFLAALAGLSCPIQDIQEYDGSINLECSRHCGCNSEIYGFSPVCGLESKTTFFSPCTAGCSQFVDLNGFVLFQNCSCGFQQVVRGACTVNDCQLAYSIYQVIYTIILAVSGASLLMQGMVLLRAVDRVDKPITIGLSFGGIGVLSFVIGHIIYMIISRGVDYETETFFVTQVPVLLWDSSVFAMPLALPTLIDDGFTCNFSSSTGECLLHQPNLWIMLVVSVFLALLSAIFSIVASFPVNKVVIPTTEL